MASIGRPARVFAWRWLFPPVHLHLSRRTKDAWWRDVTAAMDDEQHEQLHSFRNKATGWIIVAAGGLLIASKETWELVEGNEWPTWSSWVLLLGALLVSLGHAVRRTREDERTAEERRTARAGRSAATSGPRPQPPLVTRPTARPVPTRSGAGSAVRWER